IVSPKPPSEAAFLPTAGAASSRRLFFAPQQRCSPTEDSSRRIKRRIDDSLGRLYEQVIEAKSADPNLSRTAKLMRSGRAKMAKKLAEEAIEVVIDAMNGDREAVVRES